MRRFRRDYRHFESSFEVWKIFLELNECKGSQSLEQPQKLQNLLMFQKVGNSAFLDFSSQYTGRVF